MKKGSPRHRKMFGLAQALKVPLPMAVGIMEMLWQFTGDLRPQGDIGTMTPREIANAVGWEKKPELLIEALVQEHWLDRNDKYRLMIHDWPIHCEYDVCRKLIRLKSDFLPEYGVSVHDRVRDRENSAQVPRKTRAATESLCALSENIRTDPAPSREAKAKASGNGRGSGGGDPDVEPYWRELWAMDPYGTNESSCKIKWMEILSASLNPVENAADFVLNRRAWLDHCSAKSTKPLGLLKWFEGDCFKTPPQAQQAASSLYREATDD